MPLYNVFPSSATSAQLAGSISDETGTGKVVLDTSPTLVTPLLGTPTSGTLTNCAGLPPSGLTAPVDVLLWSLIGANMNTTADQALAKAFTFTNHIIDRILITNASLSLSLAVGGFYTAASKGGVAIVANTQVFSALTSNVKTLTATLGNTDLRVNTSCYLSLTTAQGSAATVDIYIFGWALT